MAVAGVVDQHVEWAGGGVAELWQRGLDRGEADPALVAGVVTDVLAGPLIFRRLAGHRALTREEAGQMTRAVLHGLVKRDT